METTIVYWGYRGFQQDVPNDFLQPCKNHPALVILAATEKNRLIFQGCTYNTNGVLISL